MTLTFYRKGDFLNAKTLENYILTTRFFHGRCEAVLHPQKQKQEVYRLDLTEYIVEAR